MGLAFVLWMKLPFHFGHWSLLCLQFWHLLVLNLMKSHSWSSVLGFPGHLMDFSIANLLQFYTWCPPALEHFQKYQVTHKYLSQL
jgi:hypothetical protein